MRPTAERNAYKRFYGACDDPRYLTRVQLVNRSAWYRAHGEPERAQALAEAWLRVPAGERIP
ncbi:MAG TPA: hypothetical protein VK437_14945 [Steroidobacteraceae bacterium]|nr:hypothetical protein [Steroidobacteraceae bacterium]